MYGIEMLNGIVNAFFKSSANDVGQIPNNDLGTTDNMPRSYNSLLNPDTLAQVLKFAKTLYDLS